MAVFFPCSAGLAGVGGLALGVGAPYPVFSTPSPGWESMFPLYDDNPTEIFPLVTLLIMGVCAGM